jgi:hypothetical protein
MKRIAALSGLLVPMLAIPATTAMASTTSGSGSGWSSPQPVRAACPLPNGFRKGHIPANAQVKVKRLGSGQAQVICRVRVPGPPRQITSSCQQQPLVFNMAWGSSTVTEVSGPQPAPGQQYSYGGSTHTIVSIARGGNFTVSLNGSQFTNQGAPVTNGQASMVCQS